MAHVIFLTAPVPWFWGLGIWGLGTGLVNKYKPTETTFEIVSKVIMYVFKQGKNVDIKLSKQNKKI